MNSKATKYSLLIEEFLQGEITALEFEATFLDCFKNETGEIPEGLFLALDQLFSDVDLFCADNELRETGDLDEEGLRQACNRTLIKIKDVQTLRHRSSRYQESI